MQLDDLLVEAKLTESDFQQAASCRSRRDFSEYCHDDLPQTARGYRSYQRYGMSGRSRGCAFCVLSDAGGQS
jgi:hypothetical protein